ncbi:hypothetical protein COZ61_00395 [Candidatus Berkelbacteria bacterium CG_4_8_14_3_um_filter_33_6]|nr:MAG: hypothetical protein COX10_00860 [Candidatus Berkelbacteria bacterium CG23_combo_of_CG06-09_8_20_14_all_33_15]PIS08497.1 MAG: hypothetical protein COT76_01085 [Candidatus Berkelbacteria bacterium CG10_big_fil_rev_8_21_14_0_10_33_10]PIX31316.1 MAG: hypothetical protein COZ61_00395 [Candidatus Berkelbacteria bacterium CG_4_8_14_3_um_filter_33_6]PIZ28545.1 MAG: hypothetical protein COY43_00100 [Candidatus Berkelbacteria bacterium CG_4_10_14_0_8_um_filter_35_9_33_8]
MRKVRSTAGIRKYHWDWEEFKYLVSVLRKANNFPDILNLFIDLHSPKEIAEIIRRVIIASYLIEELSYDKISELTGASRNTIAKINQKMWRKKAIIEQMINKAGTYNQFLAKSHDERDTLSRIIDRTIARRDIFGMFIKKR